MIAEGRKKMARSAVLPPAYLAVVKLQCWARVCAAKERVETKRERRGRQLHTKIHRLMETHGHAFGALQEMDEESSVQSLASQSVASITFLMGSTAAAEAAALATEMEVEEEQEEKKGAEGGDAEGGGGGDEGELKLKRIGSISNRGSKARRSIASSGGI
jgi:hypothetical protein